MTNIYIAQYQNETFLPSQCSGQVYIVKAQVFIKSHWNHISNTILVNLQFDRRGVTFCIAICWGWQDFFYSIT